MPVEGALDGGDEIRLAELSGREVDRDARAGDAPVHPLLELRAGLVEDGGADGGDGAGLLGALDERVRVEQAPRRVPPPYEGLDRGQLAGPDLDDGLVVQLELLGSFRQGREVGLEGDPAEDVGQHLSVEDLESVLPGVLRLVQGDVCRPQQLVGLAQDSDTRAMPMLMVRCTRWPATSSSGRSASPIRAAVSIASSTRVRSSRRIPNSSPPRRASVSALADARAEPGRHRSEHLVAGEVTEGVVDGFEVVDVAHHEGYRPAPAQPSPQQGVVHAVGEQHPVRESGERVVRRLMGELGLPLAQGGDRRLEPSRQGGNSRRP